jgi:hypothetical protein
MTDQWLQRIEERLWPSGVGRDVWMIVDAARDQRITDLLRSPYLEYSCLFSGALAPELKAVAPYLVRLNTTTTEPRDSSGSPGATVGESSSSPIR